MKILFAAAAVTALILTAGPSLAGTMPNHNCAEQNTSCISGCDTAAGGTGLNHQKYHNANQNCLANCANARASCEDRQDHTTTCAAKFTRCLDNPDLGKDLCRNVYRDCKGDNNGGGH